MFNRFLCGYAGSSGKSTVSENCILSDLFDSRPDTAGTTSNHYEYFAQIPCEAGGNTADNTRIVMLLRSQGFSRALGVLPTLVGVHRLLAFVPGYWLHRLLPLPGGSVK